MISCLNNNKKEEEEEEEEEGDNNAKKEEDNNDEEEAPVKEDRGKQSKHQPPGGKPKPPQVTRIPVAAAAAKVPSSLTVKATKSVPMQVVNNGDNDSDMEDSDGPLPDIDSGDESESD
jgi:hypothetical protein